MVTKTALAFAIPPVLFLATLMNPTPGGTSLPQMDSEASRRRNSVSGPEGWVPFSAGIRLVFQSGDVLVGTVMRNSAGARRTELRNADGSINTITLVLPESSTLYAFSPTIGWKAKRTPLQEAPFPRWLPSALGVKSADQWSDMDVYRLERDGVTTLRVPALNFEEVYSHDASTGHTLELHDIVMAEPDPSVFTPPAGVVVK